MPRKPKISMESAQTLPLVGIDQDAGLVADQHDSASIQSVTEVSIPHPVPSSQDVPVSPKSVEAYRELVAEKAPEPLYPAGSLLAEKRSRLLYVGVLAFMRWKPTTHVSRSQMNRAIESFKNSGGNL